MIYGNGMRQLGKAVKTAIAESQKNQEYTEVAYVDKDGRVVTGKGESLPAILTGDIELYEGKGVYITRDKSRKTAYIVGG